MYRSLQAFLFPGVGIPVLFTYRIFELTVLFAGLLWRVVSIAAVNPGVKCNMPTTKSAIKWMKTSEKRRTGNRALKSRIRAMRSGLHDAIAAGDKAECEKTFRRYCSVLDKAAKRGTLKANAANRRKSAAATRLAAM